ncbi:MAG: hypothetical protein KDD70_15285 [Bdellovibrionales bacterium]|nr:hypothetical protein [Bdellovibrionales bacterium]
MDPLNELTQFWASNPTVCVIIAVILIILFVRSLGKASSSEVNTLKSELNDALDQLSSANTDLEATRTELITAKEEHAKKLADALSAVESTVEDLQSKYAQAVQAGTTEAKQAFESAVADAKRDFDTKAGTFMEQFGQNSRALSDKVAAIQQKVEAGVKDGGFATQEDLDGLSEAVSHLTEAFANFQQTRTS